MSDHMLRIALTAIIAPIFAWVVFDGSKWLVRRFMKDGMLKRALLFEWWR